MARFGERRRARKPPLPAELASQFLGPECLVVTLDFFFEFVERNKHCAALVLARLRPPAKALGEPPEEHEGRDQQYRRDQQTLLHCRTKCLDGLAHRRELANDAKREADPFAVKQFKVDQLGRIELHEGIETGVDMHPDQVDLVIA
ncbi:hypothetical protein [Erythrobacter sp. HI0028]|uniref:hypothetical protein n=1 Tax=Erythrobacter sp. HI0028 TaxID=1822227 RepID=UPI001F17A4FD